MPSTMRLATPADALAVYALRLNAAEWMARRGVDQWQGEVSLARVQRQITRDEWYVAPRERVIAGALRLLRSDTTVWPVDDVPAVYVHGLVIDRRFAGRGLGGDLLAWVEAHGGATGARVLRLDCVETNPRLRRYYAELGFREVGRREYDPPSASVVLWEKPVGPAPRDA